MTRALFLADQFSDANRSRRDRYPGGAELTDAAAIAACPWPITSMTFRALAAARNAPLASCDVIVIGNSRTASPLQLTLIARTERHVTFEHDLRICRWRGNFPRARDSVHRAEQRCWCPHPEQRELFDRALGTIFLTSLQERYYRANPFFLVGNSRQLGASLFGPGLLHARESSGKKEARGTCVFASPHVIKGYAEALDYCHAHGIAPNEIRQLRPAAVLEFFERSTRFVFLPTGPEWAGRMAVEARLLGCSVVTNDLLGVAGEKLWAADASAALAWLSDGPRRFWQLVMELMNAERRQQLWQAVPRQAVLGFVASVLSAPPFRFWPAGPAFPEPPPPQEYPAW